MRFNHNRMANHILPIFFKNFISFETTTFTKHKLWLTKRLNSDKRSIKFNLPKMGRKKSESVNRTRNENKKCAGKIYAHEKYLTKFTTKPVGERDASKTTVLMSMNATTDTSVDIIEWWNVHTLYSHWNIVEMLVESKNTWQHTSGSVCVPVCVYLCEWRTVNFYS